MVYAQTYRAEVILSLGCKEQTELIVFRLHRLRELMLCFHKKVYRTELQLRPLQDLFYQPGS